LNGLSQKLNQFGDGVGVKHGINTKYSKFTKIQNPIGRQLRFLILIILA
jgi:hypothetical protein